MHERPYNNKLLLRDSDIYFKKHCIRVNIRKFTVRKFTEDVVGVYVLEE